MTTLPNTTDVNVLTLHVSSIAFSMVTNFIGIISHLSAPSGVSMASPSYRYRSLCYQTLSSPACKCLGGNQSALNIKYAVKRQKSLHAADGESRAVRKEV